MTKLKSLLAAFSILIVSGQLISAPGDLAPLNFMPDPGFQNWTPQNPIFTSDVPFGGQNEYGSYMVVDDTREKNSNYLGCDYGELIFVADGLPFASNDPTTRFLLIEYVIDVYPQRDYDLSFRYMNPDIEWPDYLPEISVEIDGIEVMQPTEVENLGENCDPYLFEHSFYSGNRTQIRLSIYNNAIYRYPVNTGVNANSIVGNDVALWGFEMYQYCTLDDIDLGTFQVCEGDAIPLIEKTAIDADGGSTITWDFELGGTFTGQQIIDYVPTDNEIVYVEIEDGLGCTVYDTFNINVFKFPDDIEIGSNLQEPRLCPCEMAQLEVPDNLPVGNFIYEWSAADPDIVLQGTDQTILDIDTPSEYYLTITEENLGCSTTLAYTVGDIGGSVDVTVSDVVAEIGESVTVEISSTVSQEFIDCGFEEITATMLYDYTVLHNGEIGYDIKDANTAGYDITIPNNGSLEIPFTVLLGLSRSSEISLFGFQVECGDYDSYVNIGAASVEVSGICDQPNPRLIDPRSQFAIQNTQISGDMLYTTLDIQETTQHTVSVYDITGAAVCRSSFEGTTNQQKLLELDISRLSQQMIFVNISTAAESYTFMLVR